MELLNNKTFQSQNQRYLSPQNISENKLSNRVNKQMNIQNSYQSPSIQPKQIQNGLIIGGQQNQNQQSIIQAFGNNQNFYQINDRNVIKTNLSKNKITQKNYQNNEIITGTHIINKSNQPILRDFQQKQSQSIDTIPLKMNELQFKSLQKNVSLIQPQKNNFINQHKTPLINQSQMVSSNKINQIPEVNHCLSQNKVQNEIISSPKNIQMRQGQFPLDKIRVLNQHQNNQQFYQLNQENNNTQKNQQIVYIVNNTKQINENNILKSKENYLKNDEKEKLEFNKQQYNINGIRLLNQNIITQNNKISSDSKILTLPNDERGNKKVYPQQIQSNQYRQNCHQQEQSLKKYIIKTEGQENQRIGVRLLSQESDGRLQDFQKQIQQQDQHIKNLQNRSSLNLNTTPLQVQFFKLQRSTSIQLPDTKPFLVRQSSQQMRHNSSLSQRELNSSQQFNNQIVTQTPTNSTQKCNPMYFSSSPNHTQPPFFNSNENSSQSLRRQNFTPIAANTLQYNSQSLNPQPCSQLKLINQQQVQPHNLEQVLVQNSAHQSTVNKNELIAQQNQKFKQLEKISSPQSAQIIPSSTQMISSPSQQIPAEYQIIANQPQFQLKSQVISRKGSTHSQGNTHHNNIMNNNTIKQSFDKQQKFQSYEEKNPLNYQNLVRDLPTQYPQSLPKQAVMISNQNPEHSNGIRQIYYSNDSVQDQSQENPLSLKLRRSSFDYVCEEYHSNDRSPTFMQITQNGELKNQFQTQNLKNEKYDQNIQNFQSFGQQIINNDHQEKINKQNEQTKYPDQYQQNQTYIDPSQHLNKQIINQTCESSIYGTNSKESTIKSPIQNTSMFKKGEYDSPINIIQLPQNQTLENKNILQQNINEFNHTKSPNKNIQYLQEDNISNQQSPQSKQSLVQSSINQYCDEMMNLIEQEKYLRSIENSNNTPRSNNQIKDSRSQSRDIMNHQDKIQEINIKRDSYQNQQIQENTPKRSSFSPMQQYTAIPVHQQYSPQINHQNIVSNNQQNALPIQKQNSPQLIQITQQQIEKQKNQISFELLNLNQQEETVKRAHNQNHKEQKEVTCEGKRVYNNTQQNNQNFIQNSYNVYQNEYYQQQNHEFHEQENQIKNIQKNYKNQNNSSYQMLNQEYSNNIQYIENNNKEDDFDFFNIGDPQFTFSNTKKNISFEQQQFEEEMQNEFKFNQIEQDAVLITPKSNHKKNEQNFILQQLQCESEFVQGLNLCERIIDTDGDKSFDNKQTFEENSQQQYLYNSQDNKPKEQEFHNISRSPRDQYYQRNNEKGQKSPQVLSQQNKFDTPDKHFEKLAQNQQQYQIDQIYNQVSHNNQGILPQKLAHSPNRYSPSKQNEQKMILYPQQYIETNECNKKTKGTQPNTKQEDNLKEQKNLDIDCFNNMIEKSLEQNQRRFSSQNHFSPKVQIEQEQNVQDYETSKENSQISILQQSIQKKIEKIIPDLKEYEVNKITQSIYDSVFEVMREKYNQETPSSNKFRDSQFLNQSSQNSGSTQRYFSNQKYQQIEKLFQEQQQQFDMINKNIQMQKEQPVKIMQKQQKEVNVSYSFEGIYYENKDQQIDSKKLQQSSRINQTCEESEADQNHQTKQKNNNNEFYDSFRYVRESSSVINNSNTNEEQTTYYNHRRQSEDFRKLLQAQKSQEAEQMLDAQQSGQMEEHKDWIDEGTTYVNPHSPEQKKYINQRSEDDYLYKNQNELSPIREIESTYDQIQQSNQRKNTNKGYQTTSPDEKCHAGKFKTQKSQSNLQTEEYDEEEEFKNKQQIHNEQQKQTTRSFSNSLHDPNSLSYQQFNLINQQLINKINLKNLNPKELEMRSKIIQCFEARKVKLSEEIQKKQEIPINRQAYYENNKQKAKKCLPISQYEQYSIENQVLQQVTTHTQNKSQNNQQNSRRNSFQYVSKQQSSIDDWDQLSQNSRMMSFSNGFTQSFSNLNSRKGSLNSLAIFSPSLSSSQSIQCQLAQQVNQRIQKEEKQTNAAKSFAQEYVKKCMTQSRKQEPQLMKKIKSTLMANLKNGKNNQKDENKYQRSKSNENQIIKDLIIKKY